MQKVLIVILAMIMFVVFIKVINLISNEVKKKKQVLKDKDYIESFYKDYRKHHKEEMFNEVSLIRHLFETNESNYSLKIINEYEYKNNLNSIEKYIRKVENKYGIE